METTCCTKKIFHAKSPKPLLFVTWGVCKSQATFILTQSSYSDISCHVGPGHSPALPCTPFHACPCAGPSAHCRVTGSSLPLSLPSSPTRGAQVRRLLIEAFCAASCADSARVSTAVFCLPGFSRETLWKAESSL